MYIARTLTLGTGRLISRTPFPPATLNSRITSPSLLPTTTTFRRWYSTTDSTSVAASTTTPSATESEGASSTEQVATTTTASVEPTETATSTTSIEVPVEVKTEKTDVPATAVATKGTTKTPYKKQHQKQQPQQQQQQEKKKYTPNKAQTSNVKPTTTTSKNDQTKTTKTTTTATTKDQKKQNLKAPVTGNAPQVHKPYNMFDQITLASITEQSFALNLPSNLPFTTTKQDYIDYMKQLSTYNDMLKRLNITRQADDNKKPHAQLLKLRTNVYPQSPNDVYPSIKTMLPVGTTIEFMLNNVMYLGIIQNYHSGVNLLVSYLDHNRPGGAVVVNGAKVEIWDVLGCWPQDYYRLNTTDLLQLYNNHNDLVVLAPDRHAAFIKFGAQTFKFTTFNACRTLLDVHPTSPLASQSPSPQNMYDTFRLLNSDRSIARNEVTGGYRIESRLFEDMQPFIDRVQSFKSMDKKPKYFDHFNNDDNKFVVLLYLFINHPEKHLFQYSDLAQIVLDKLGVEFSHKGARQVLRLLGMELHPIPNYELGDVLSGICPRETAVAMNNITKSLEANNGKDMFDPLASIRKPFTQPMYQVYRTDDDKLFVGNCLFSVVMDSDKVCTLYVTCMDVSPYIKDGPNDTLYKSALFSKMSFYQADNRQGMDRLRVSTLPQAFVKAVTERPLRFGITRWTKLNRETMEQLDFGVEPILMDQAKLITLSSNEALDNMKSIDDIKDNDARNLFKVLKTLKDKRILPMSGTNNRSRNPLGSFFRPAIELADKGLGQYVKAKGLPCISFFDAFQFVTSSSREFRAKLSMPLEKVDDMIMQMQLAWYWQYNLPIFSMESINKIGTPSFELHEIHRDRRFYSWLVALKDKLAQQSGEPAVVPGQRDTPIVAKMNGKIIKHDSVKDVYTIGFEEYNFTDSSVPTTVCANKLEIGDHVVATIQSISWTKLMVSYKSIERVDPTTSTSCESNTEQSSS
ncbi:hypothetical protein SAMD00019534_003710 [Acytostelium subglobosum LB1]|uniref:hypothetical protein n=1 Tax=Acytostelium subglobosum LB1 TaxID=1410327 RepID=UPI000644E43B|nr:hypothetical protein SAMD00019534_003710 [Acytostelium subglobosum LB1]GAM17196.1 hypothetical protein SAMD00019534_003710 [Acytostelium subglobosum LB1]|eukprot:XP_012759258.1 hypothetical protein SAMD00019534_003710 [Acytostelium subglobosum LB1]